MVVIILTDVSIKSYSDFYNIVARFKCGKFVSKIFLAKDWTMKFYLFTLMKQHIIHQSHLSFVFGEHNAHKMNV